MPEEINGNGQDQHSEESSTTRRILDSLPEEQETDEENLDDSEDSEETTEDTEEGNESDLVNSEITEELAQVLGLSKTYIGKPLSEAGKAYKETVKWENKNNTAIKKIEEQLSKLTTAQTKELESEANTETNKKLGKIPDPITEPEKFNQWLIERDNLIIEKLQAKVDEKFSKDPTILQAQEMAAREMEKLTLSSLQELLPDDVKANDVLDEWLEANKDDYEEMIKTGFYKNKPERFVRDVIAWYKADSYDSLKNETESNIQKKIHKKVTENLRKKSTKTKNDFSSSQRTETTDENSTASRLLRKLEEQSAMTQSS